MPEDSRLRRFGMPSIIRKLRQGAGFALFRAMGGKVRYMLRIFGMRRTAAAAAFLIVLLATTLVLSGVKNLIQWNHQLGRASFADGIDAAKLFCDFSEDDREAIRSTIESNEEYSKMVSEWNDIPREERIEIISDFQGAVIETPELPDFLLLNIIFRGFAFSHVVSSSINVALHSEDSLPFRSLMLEKEQNLASSKRERFGQILDILLQSDRDIFGSRGFRASMKFWQNYFSNCKLDLYRISSIPKSSLVKHIITAATGTKLETFWGIAETARSRNLMAAYRNFDMRHGGHVLSFTNPDAYIADSTAARLSILLPKSPDHAADFLNNVIRWILWAWFFVVLSLVVAGGWLISTPLRNLGRASRKAASILAGKEDVSKKLRQVKEEFCARTTEFPEFESLLHETESLLGERELWLDQHLHQLKNDLVAISYAIKGIEMRQGAELSAIQDVNGIIERISGVLNSVASYQLTLHGKEEPKTLIDLCSALETIRDEIEDAGGDAVCKGCEGIYLNAQSAAIQSAFQNLIWNAHHHGGRVCIECKLIGKGKTVQVLIEDDGPGIQEERIEEMFEPYRQGQPGTKKSSGSFRGAGLGLTIARRIILQHGGQIGLSNRKSVGGRIEGLSVRVALPTNN